jgi:hypothetical protein
LDRRIGDRSTLWPVTTLRQICSGLAAVAGALATLALLVVAAGTPGLRIRGSVSQLGAVGEPLADTYRVAIYAIAVAVGLLAFAVAPVSLPAGFALATVAGLGALSAAVRCTPGCPLPPEPTASAADVVHVAASVAAFVGLAVAMLLLALSGRDRLANVCRTCVVLMIALGTPVGVALLVTGEGLLNGVFERAMMAVALAWLVLTAVLAARPSTVDLRS